MLAVDTTAAAGRRPAMEVSTNYRRILYAFLAVNPIPDFWTEMNEEEHDVKKRRGMDTVVDAQRRVPYIIIIEEVS